jgi:hypothetical protein
MTHVCCLNCMLRFTPAVSAYLFVCPECGAPLQPVASLRETVGFRLVVPEDLPYSVPQAGEVSMPDPTTVTDR